MVHITHMEKFNKQIFFMKSKWVQLSFYFGKMFISGTTQSYVPPLKIALKTIWQQSAQVLCNNHVYQEVLHIDLLLHSR